MTYYPNRHVYLPEAAYHYLKETATQDKRTIVSVINEFIERDKVFRASKDAKVDPLDVIIAKLDSLLEDKREAEQEIKELADIQARAFETGKLTIGEWKRLEGATDDKQ